MRFTPKIKSEDLNYLYGSEYMKNKINRINSIEITMMYVIFWVFFLLLGTVISRTDSTNIILGLEKHKLPSTIDFTNYYNQTYI